MPPVVTVDGEYLDFNNVADPIRFKDPKFTKAIYKANIADLWKETVSGTVVDEIGDAHKVDLAIYQWCRFRILKLQAALSRYFLNYDSHIEMMLSCAIAQEPVLFVGLPGVAKTELAISFFGGIGLRRPMNNGNVSGNESKYFEYLLSPYTVPEELFGLLDFKELENGVVTRINTNMITGKLVSGVFLDEIFNASSNILNTLLTLINERRFFDKGMFQQSDLKILIGASNETPVSKYGSGHGLTGKKVAELRAFYDRFTLRLYFPTPQELYPTNETMIREMYTKIIEISQDRALEKLTKEKPVDFPQVACLNDILLLGRLIGTMEFEGEVLDLIYSLISGLSIHRPANELCSMSPRKANKLLPVILANFFLPSVDKPVGDITDMELLEYVKGQSPEITEDRRTEEGVNIIKVRAKVTIDHLRIFHHIWDYENEREHLKAEINTLLEHEL